MNYILAVLLILLGVIIGAVVVVILFAKGFKINF